MTQSGTHLAVLVQRSARVGPMLRLGGGYVRMPAVDRLAAEALLERLHQAQNAMYAGGDVAPVRSLLTEDVRWSVPGANAIAGRYRGIEEVLAYFQRRRALANATLRLHPGELLVGAGEHVSALTDGSATIGGVERRWSTVGLYRVRDERIAACWLLPLDQATFDRAWAGVAATDSGAADRPLGIDHVQIAAPPGCEEQARRFYSGVLGLAEVDKPEALVARGGAWFSLGAQQLHVGVEKAFAPARKAHPAIRVATSQLAALAARLAEAGAPVNWDSAIPGTRRFYTEDPWGNRLELLSAEERTR
jgi:catechol 2,3-dioxygenase-like lactoylglutathione lyase family enzyme/ketosteroid isomerase-like protein